MVLSDLTTPLQHHLVYSCKARKYGTLVPCKHWFSLPIATVCSNYVSMKKKGLQAHTPQMVVTIPENRH